MPAKPKLSPEQWSTVRKKWEGDEREGFTWLIDELKLGISPQAIRKVAARDGWTKKEVGKTKSVKKKSKDTQVTHNHGKVAQKPSRSNQVTIVEHDSKRGRGRLTDYRQEYNEQAYRLCLLGAIDEELAEFFHVQVSTLNNWKRAYPEFLASIERGKLIADAEVAESTFKSATGKHVITEDRLVGGQVVTFTKQIPPDVSAQRLWLFNRRPKQWKNKVEVKDDTNINAFPPKEVLDAIYENALAEAAKRREMLAERRKKLNMLLGLNSSDIETV